jgi:ATP-dependent Clp protease, protease subunit
MSRNISEHSEQFHDHGLYLPTRTIYIDGDEDADFEVTLKSARRDIKNLHVLDNLGTGVITVVMNCIGGDTLAAMSIYDTILGCKNHVVIVAHQAQSMGSIILQAGDERILMPNATVMIHNGEVGRSGSPKTVENWQKYDKIMDARHEKIYLDKIKQKKPRFTKEQLQKLLEHDTIFTAQEAVAMGLADKVME